jgi:hypothetical protein
VTSLGPDTGPASQQIRLERLDEQQLQTLGRVEQAKPGKASEIDVGALQAMKVSLPPHAEEVGRIEAALERAKQKPKKPPLDDKSVLDTIGKAFDKFEKGA